MQIKIYSFQLKEVKVLNFVKEEYERDERQADFFN